MNIQALVQEAEYNGILVRPLLCETCNEQKTLIRHHRDYDKPLEVTWLCQSCHRKEHCANKELRDPNNNRKSVQFGQTLWEQIGDATRRYNSKHNTLFKEAEYVRNVVERHCVRKAKAEQKA